LPYLAWDDAPAEEPQSTPELTQPDIEKESQPVQEEPKETTPPKPESSTNEEVIYYASKKLSLLKYFFYSI
jgi:hypothetical protein